MRQLIALLLSLLLVSPGAAVAKGKRDPAEAAYEAARRDYYALKDDAKRRSFRHNWLNVVEKFEAVARKYPRSDRAPDALYTAAELRSDLSRVSMLNEDLRAAVDTYEQLVSRYPKDNLADDAALALARIHVDRTGDTEKARRFAERALKDNPTGDARGKLKALLATLPHTPSAPAQGKRLAAKTVQAPAVAKAEKEPASAAREASGSRVETASPAAREVASASTSASSSGSDASSSDESHGSSDSAPQSARDALAEAIARASRAPKSSRDPAPRDGNDTRAEPARPADARHSHDEEFSAPPMVEAPAEPPPARAQAHAHAPAAEPGKTESAAQPMSAQEARKLASVVKSTDDELTLAEQLGLKVRRVVIDAGHGGHDTGAIGKKGTREKDVTLAIAKRVGEILSERGLEVILTRDDDTFVRLEDRTRIANEAKGDLFISIHCNASESRKVRGTETFTLNVAADRYSIRLAARENASSEKSVSDLQFILADLATKANTEESQRLAKRVQQSLVTGLRREHSGIRDLGTKQALFYVLLGAKMPAILVETAFVSNPNEEKLLASKKFQEDTAVSIADGVQAFLDDRGRLARID